MDNNLHTPDSPEYHRYSDLSLRSYAEAEQRRLAAEMYYRTQQDDYWLEELEERPSKLSSVLRTIRSLPEALKIHRNRLCSFIGAVAIVGALAAPAAAKASPDSYIVQPGDSLSQIANQHHLSLAQLLAQNPKQQITPGLIQPKEVLTINIKEESPAVHIVKIGDSLSSIAYEHEMTLTKILKLNPEFQDNPRLIYPGQKVWLIKKSSSAQKSAPSHTAKTPEKKKTNEAKDPAAKQEEAKTPDLEQLAAENWTLWSKNLDVLANAKEPSSETKETPGSKKSDTKPASRHASTAPQPQKDIPLPKYVTSIPNSENYDLDPFGLNNVMPWSWAEWAKEHPAEAEKHVAKISKKHHKHYTVEDFIAAIASQESGGDPNAVNSGTKAFGYTQIMPENWPTWSEEALGRIAPQTPENQLLVSRHKMNKYHAKYKDWGAVAIAWFAGPARADRYAAGDMSVLAIGDGHWSVKQYVDHMQANIGKADPHKIFPDLDHKKSKKSKKKAKKSNHKHQAKKIIPLTSLFGFVEKSKDGLNDISPFLLPSAAHAETAEASHARRHSHKHKHNRTKNYVSRAKSAVKTRKVAGTEWSWPVSKDMSISDCWHTSRPGHAHSGVDITAPEGLPVRAAAKGKVVLARNNTPPVTGFGKTVFLEHKGRGGQRRYTLYGHLSSFDKNINDGKVNRGEIIGRVGNTGNSYGNHLHFNVQSAPVPVGDANRPGTVNPIDYLPHDKRPNPANCKG